MAESIANNQIQKPQLSENGLSMFFLTRTTREWSQNGGAMPLVLIGFLHIEIR